jgi:hypothetical protein
VGEEVTVPRKAAPWKCRQGKWCSSMADRLDEVNSTTKGISELVLMNLRTGKDEKPIGIVFKKRAADRGLMLNYCPWCGERVFFGETKKKAKK